MHFYTKYHERIFVVHILWSFRTRLTGPEENVATLRHGAKVIDGEMKASLLDGDSVNYDLDRGFTRHPIDGGEGSGVVIQLGMPYIINTVRMLLWDRDMRYVPHVAAPVDWQLFITK